MMSFRNLFGKLIPFAFCAFLLLIIQGCETTETTDSTVSLSFSTVARMQKISDDTLTLDTVKILLRDVKLKNESEDDDGDGIDHQGEEVSVKVGPFVVCLNLNGVTTDFAVSNISPGTYNEIKFKIHKLEASETPPDPEFEEGDDNSLRYSVIVKGMYNSNPFIYKSRKSAHQKINLKTPLVVEPNTLTNLTITVDPYTWFTNDGEILDPTNLANENDIDNNIKESFKQCFKDDNRDGDDD
ncbi:MAG TPA: hypothetical protein VIY47_08920 [Ignavibacteriaceae bacterium]